MGDVKRRKTQVLAKLGWVCRKIEAILAGQNVTLSDIALPQHREPGETPLERLQRFKALLNEALAELNRGEARACGRCGALLPDVVLDEIPWASCCQACAGG